MSRHLQTPSAVTQERSFLYPLERLLVGCAVGDDDEDIYLLQLGFRPVAVVGRLVQK